MLPSLLGPTPRLVNPLNPKGPPRKNRSLREIDSDFLSGIISPFASENCVV